MAARRMGVIGLVFCLCLSLMPCGAQAVSTADAAEPLSPERECTLTLSYICDGRAFEGVTVELYQIATASAQAQYTPTAPFLTSGLGLNGIQSVGQWDVIRSTLEAHILAKAIEADFVAVTNQAGQVHFQSLEPGLYLAISGRAAQDGLQCSFDSAFVALPGLDADGLWQYQLTVTPKPELTLPPEPDDPDEDIQFKVLKLWKGENNHTERPQSIEVEIFRDGKSHQIVTLSEDNYWSYAWTATADGADWMVVERNIPVGYTLTVEQRATTFILTNTLLPDEPPEDVPPTAPPKTGDTPHILLYTVLMYGSGMGLVLLGITGKRKRP